MLVVSSSSNLGSLGAEVVAEGKSQLLDKVSRGGDELFMALITQTPLLLRWQLIIPLLLRALPFTISEMGTWVCEEHSGLEAVAAYVIIYLLSHSQ
ncbi:hypothetical protein ACFX15_039268 [Malus domestica]